MCPTEISLPNNQVGRKHLHIDVRGLQWDQIKQQRKTV